MYAKWRSTFLLALLQYGLDLWEQRNSNLHGDTPSNQRVIRRQKAIQRAQVKYLEGADTVLPPQQRLFLHFPRRLEGRTRAIESWIELVEIAQEKQRNYLQRTATQPTLLQYDFVPQERTPQQVETVIQRHMHDQIIENINTTRNNWAQQDLRRLMLLPNPNVKRKESSISYAS